MSPPRTFLAALFFGLTACTGTIGDTAGDLSGGGASSGGGAASGGGATNGGGAANGGGGVGGGGPVAACAPGEVRLGPAPARRLAHAEYDNTLRDLLGDNRAPARQFPQDPTPGGYDNNVALAPSEVLLESYLASAETASANAVRDLGAFLPCTPGQDGATEDACAARFIRDFGLKAYRHPVDAEETAILTNVYRSARAITGQTFAGAIRVVIATILQSPQFLYRLEFGTPAAGAGGTGRVALTDYEVATRLSYTLWGTMPDAALFQAAAAGKLHTAADVAGAARAMLSDAKARQGLARFSSQWMPVAKLDTVAKDAKLFPDWNPRIAGALRQEVTELVNDVVFSGDGKFKTLLTTPTSMMTAELASFYGMRGAATTTAFQRVNLDPARYAGVLTRAGVLASGEMSDVDRPHQVRRGVFIRSHFLCQSLPPPPAGIDTTVPPPGANETARQSLERRTSVEPCAGCHRMINPIGFGFEAFDATGRHRTTDNGVPVDASGEIWGVEELATDVDGAFTGAVELAHKLGSSRMAASCFAAQYFQYAAGREPIGDDACVLDALNQRGQRTDYDLRELMVTLLSSPEFLNRQAGDTP